MLPPSRNETRTPLSDIEPAGPTAAAPAAHDHAAATIAELRDELQHRCHVEHHLLCMIDDLRAEHALRDAHEARMQAAIDQLELGLRSLRAQLQRSKAAALQQAEDARRKTHAARAALHELQAQQRSAAATAGPNVNVAPGGMDDSGDASSSSRCSQPGFRFSLNGEQSSAEHQHMDEEADGAAARDAALLGTVASHHASQGQHVAMREGWLVSSCDAGGRDRSSGAQHGVLEHDAALVDRAADASLSFSVLASQRHHTWSGSAAVRT